MAQIDQGGLSLPNRDYYLKTDDKSKEILTKYRAHMQKMFVLAGESEAQADADAGTVIELETGLAQAQMDNVTRRDPKNINNKMTLAQVRELDALHRLGRLSESGEGSGQRSLHRDLARLLPRRREADPGSIRSITGRPTCAGR